MFHLGYVFDSHDEGPSIGISSWLIDLLIDWCLTVTLAVFQPYQGNVHMY